MIKFQVGPSAKTASIPSAFGSFDGLRRTCVGYKRAKGGVMRCADYKKGRGHPTCKGLKAKNVRSHGLLRTQSCGHTSKRRAKR